MDSRPRASYNELRGPPVALSVRRRRVGRRACTPAHCVAVCSGTADGDTLPLEAINMTTRNPNALNRRGRLLRPVLPLAVVCAATALGARAAPYELLYSGTFNGSESLTRASSTNPSFFTGTTPFTVEAYFDDTGPNLAPTFGGPFSGFRAYSPSSAKITIGGNSYSIDAAASNAAAGVAVAIFDRASFTPGRYGVGLFADPVHDGAGIVGDFASASPDFSAGALQPTGFGDYAGVGHSSGVCLSGSAPACPHALTPWVLHDSSNATWSLAIGNYEEDYGALTTPGAMLGSLNTAAILAVPEPATSGSMLAGLIGLAALAHRRRHRQGRSPA